MYIKIYKKKTQLFESFLSLTESFLGFQLNLSLFWVCFESRLKFESFLGLFWVSFWSHFWVFFESPTQLEFSTQLEFFLEFSAVKKTQKKTQRASKKTHWYFLGPVESFLSQKKDSTLSLFWVEHFYMGIGLKKIPEIIFQ